MKLRHGWQQIQIQIQIQIQTKQEELFVWLFCEVLYDEIVEGIL